ncbi:MAG: outer membrane beta-barrel protein [Bacteroidetes bacterium]|jgi:hypothetical protein|nr:outer membrane beta-barrel protein [Bacteroidota bacterium]
MNSKKTLALMAAFVIGSSSLLGQVFSLYASIGLDAANVRNLNDDAEWAAFPNGGIELHYALGDRFALESGLQFSKRYLRLHGAMLLLNFGNYVDFPYFDIPLMMRYDLEKFGLALSGGVKNSFNLSTWNTMTLASDGNETTIYYILNPVLAIDKHIWRRFSVELSYTFLGLNKVGHEEATGLRNYRIWPYWSLGLEYRISKYNH